MGTDAGVYMAPGFHVGPSHRLGLLAGPLFFFKGRFPKPESSNENFGGSQYKMFIVGPAMEFGLEYRFYGANLFAGLVLKDHAYMRLDLGFPL